MTRATDEATARVALYPQASRRVHAVLQESHRRGSGDDDRQGPRDARRAVSATPGPAPEADVIRQGTNVLASVGGRRNGPIPNPATSAAPAGISRLPAAHLPQPENPRLGTPIRLAAVMPLSFPPGDQPAPVRPDCVWCQRRPAVRDQLCAWCLADRADQAADRLNNNGPVTASTVPAHDQPGEDPDGHLGE